MKIKFALRALLFSALGTSALGAGAQQTVTSPDKRTTVVITPGAMAIVHNGQPLASCRIGITMDSAAPFRWDEKPRLAQRTSDQWIHKLFSVKYKNIEDHFNDKNPAF